MNLAMSELTMYYCCCLSSLSQLLLQVAEEKRELEANLDKSTKQAVELEKQVEELLQVGSLLPQDILAMATYHLFQV